MQKKREVDICNFDIWYLYLSAVLVVGKNGRGSGGTKQLRRNLDVCEHRESTERGREWKKNKNNKIATGIEGTNCVLQYMYV